MNLLQRNLIITHPATVYTKMYEKELSDTDADGEFSKVWEVLLDILKILELKNLETYETCMESSLEKRT